MVRRIRYLRLLRIGVTFVAVGMSAVIYQNCASNIETPATAATTTPEDLDARTIRALLEPGAAASCDDITAYQCEIRTFGPTQRDSQDRSTHCFADDNCVELLSFTFNTEANISDCAGCSAEDITARYDHTEIRCMNTHVPVAGTLPIQAEGDSLQNALNLAQNKCRDLAARGQ